MSFINYATIGPYLLPKVLPGVRRRYPLLQLRIMEEQSHALVDMVRNGELDTAILALPFDIDGLLRFEFWEEDFYWITHQDDSHSIPKEITGDELKQSHLMLLKEGHCLKDHVLAACKLQPSETDAALAATSLNTLMQMVAGRMGTTLVPEMALGQLLGSDSELKAAHLNEPGPHRRIAFIARPNYAGVNNIEKLIQLFRRELMSEIAQQHK